MDNSEISSGCQISECDNKVLPLHLHDGVWVSLCMDHSNRLAAYIINTQQHEDFLISHSAFVKAMSPYPSSTGIGDDADAISEHIRLEIIMRNIINGWTEDPNGTEDRIKDR